MNPSTPSSDHDPKRDQNDGAGGSSRIESGTASAAQSASSQHPVKTNSKSLLHEVREILLSKAQKAAESLKPIMADSVLSKAAETIATEESRKLMESAVNYARKSTSAVNITAQDLLNAILVAQGITTKKTRRSKVAKKNTKENKKGGNHGNKS